jgi:hypothetical protein
VFSRHFDINCGSTVRVCSNECLRQRQWRDHAPSGFCATIFADNLGHARQMAFGPNGVLYLNTWSGGYYQNDKPPDGGFLIALKDTKGDGRADMIERFGDGVAQGSAGGTGYPCPWSRPVRRTK